MGGVVRIDVWLGATPRISTSDSKPIARSQSRGPLGYWTSAARPADIYRDTREHAGPVRRRLLLHGGAIGSVTLIPYERMCRRDGLQIFATTAVSTTVVQSPDKRSAKVRFLHGGLMVLVDV